MRSVNGSVGLNTTLRLEVFPHLLSLKDRGAVEWLVSPFRGPHCPLPYSLTEYAGR